MTFESPFIKQAITEIRFKPLLRFHQKRIEICENFVEKLPRWRLTLSMIEMYDEEKKEESQRIFSMSNRGASLIFNDVGHYANFQALASHLLSNVTSIMEITDIARFGVRFFYLSEYKDSFDELQELLIGKLFKNELIEYLEIEKRTSDLAYVLNFSKEDTKIHLALGPLSIKEIEERFGEKEVTLETALLIDLDLFLENAPYRIINRFLKDSYDESQAILEKVLNYLKGE